jgi:hypothetical protein
LSVVVDALPYATRALVARVGAASARIADGRRPAREVAAARAGVAARRVTCARIAEASRCAARRRDRDRLADCVCARAVRCRVHLQRAPIGLLGR